MVDAFKSFGFIWGGDYDTAKAPAHFEFMADPSRIAIVKPGIAQAAAAAAAYGAPTGGLNIGVYLSDREPEFFRAAKVFRKEYDAQIYPVTNAQEIINAVRNHEKIGRLVLFGHGGPKGFLKLGEAGISSNRKRDSLPEFITVETFAKEIAPRLTDGAIIGLAACSAGANPGEFKDHGWTPPMYGPGGENSFAADLRDALAVYPGIAKGIHIRAHSTKGNTVTNAAAREFLVDSSEIGKPGYSVLDLFWGPGAYLNMKEEWVAKFSGKPATEWMHGGNINEIEVG
jgi:hypothetical protein